MLGAAVGLLVFLLYLGTLAPTVMSYSWPLHFDTPMLQTQAATLSIAHPTGYPGYMLLTHPFTYLPFGDVAYRVNLASAVYSATAVVMVYVVGLQLTRRMAAAAAGALLFGTGATFWSQSIVAAVYSLNALFIMVTFSLLLLWRSSGRDRYLLASALLMGLSMTNHMTSGLLLPAGGLFVLAVAPRRLLDPRLLLKGAGAFLLGLSVYLYLPIRTYMDAPLTETDPSTPGRFLEVVTGGGMEGNTFAFGPGALPGRLEMYLGYLVQNFHPAFLVFGVVGVAYLLLRDWRSVVLPGSFYLAYLAFALGYDIPDIFNYFIPTYLMVALVIAAGLGALLDTVQELLQRSSPAAGKVAVVLLALPLLVLPLFGVDETYREEDLSDEYEGRRIIEAVAENVEENATVIHYRSPLWYMVLVEERRQDLTLVASFDAPWTRYQNVVWPDPEDEDLTALYRMDHSGVWATGRALEDGPVYILDQETANPRAFRAHGYGFIEVDGEAGLFQIAPVDRPSEP